MKSVSLATVAIAVTSLATLVSANTCTYRSCDDCGLFINSWNIDHSGGVDFSPAFCKGFWDNLRCPAPSVRTCDNAAADGHGFIQFNVGIACNAGDIESAWWRATKNEFGSISCVSESAEGQ
ncbi:hypothetical protein N7499_012301 [Penicillium canescens]|nr:hypothetical protein N7499_012301 [Penicillium canescens]KAJ6154882.1 hypothetical protein N7485_013251 [Penicillium canescens]